jgi:hypothetical protein
MRACVGPLKSASRIATERPLATSAEAKVRVTVLFPTPPFPEPIATRWRTLESARAIRSRCSRTCPKTFEPPSPIISWYDFIREAYTNSCTAKTPGDGRRILGGFVGRRVGALTH